MNTQYTSVFVQGYLLLVALNSSFKEVIILRIAKQAVQFYCAITGNSWSDFYSRLEEALSAPADTEDRDLW